MYSSSGDEGSLGKMCKRTRSGGMRRAFFFFRQPGLYIIKQSRKELSRAPRPPSRYPSLKVQEKSFLLPPINLFAHI